MHKRVKFPNMNPNNFKLIAFDLDGTLLDSEKQISAYTRQTIDRLAAKGIQFTIATGRILPLAKNYADELDINHPLILANGSVLQTRQGKMINQSFLSREIVQIVIDTCQSEEMEMNAVIGENIYYQKGTDGFRPLHRKSIRKKHKIDNWEEIEEKLSQVNKCAIVDFNDESNLVRLDKILQQKLNGSARTLRTSQHMLEILPKGITKAAGLRMLANTLGIEMRQIIAFGDHNNDAEMMAEVGLGIAVGDATPSCLENADMVVASSDEDGPAHFLEEFLLAP